jgi:multidrug efflux system membrane fusion protein
MADHDYDVMAEQRAPKAAHSLRNALIALAAIIFIGLGIWFFAGPAKPKEGGTKTNKGRLSATVGAIKVSRADMPVSLNAIGTVQPIVNATVRPQLAGVLFAIHFTEGQHVNRGAALAQIDPRPYRLTLQQVQGTLAKDMATLNSARVDLRRYQVLLSQDSIARQQVDTQAATVRQLEGTIAADMANVGTARLNLGYTTVRAPVAGKVGLRAADIGSYLTPSDANGIVVITQTNPIDVSFALPQAQIAQVQKAAHGGPLPVTILDQANTTVIAHGQFHTFDNAIDATSGTVKAKARVQNEQETLFPNQFVNVQLLVDTLSQAIVVPVTAVRTGPSGSFVYTMTADKVAHRVAVTTGPSDGNRTAILSGLNGDETVIFEGADRIDDGSKVTTADGKGHGGKPGGGTGAGAAGGHHHGQGAPAQ